MKKVLFVLAMLLISLSLVAKATSQNVLNERVKTLEKKLN